MNRKYKDTIDGLKNYNVVCDDCACNETWTVGKMLMTDALEIINSLQAENENLNIELQALRNAANLYKKENIKLQQDNYALASDMDYLKSEIDQLIRDAKLKLAEQIKDKFFSQMLVNNIDMNMDSRIAIDRLVENK